MYLSATIEDKPVSRAYTPTSSDDDIGHFDLVIKVYLPLKPFLPQSHTHTSQHTQVYPQGKMTQHLDSLKIGDTILVQGPKGITNAHLLHLKPHASTHLLHHRSLDIQGQR